MAERDADLANVASTCFLFLPNTEDNVKLYADAIREFAYSSMGRRIERELIAPFIDQRLKEEKRLAFFEEMINLGRSRK